MGVKVKEKVKGSGQWWIFIHHKGKRMSKKVGKDKTQALKAAKIIEAKLALGEFNILDKEQIPFRQYAAEWLTGTIQPTRTPSTMERYRGILAQHIVPEIGHKNLADISRADIRRVLAHVHKKGLSHSSVRLVRDVLSGVMGCAEDEELVAKNPVTNVLKRMGLEKRKKPPITPLTVEEAKHFLSVCREHYAAHYPFFLCAFRTGMRLGELLALKWGDIDWNQGSIHIERSFRRGEIGKTKTGKTRRVDMSSQLRETLRYLLTKRKREALQTGISEEIPWIFHKNGLPIPQNSIRNIFKRILKKAGMRQIRLHDIRHTFASLLLSNGETPVYVKEQLGHASIQITVDVYGHLIPSSNRQAVDRLDDLETPPNAPQAHPQKIKSP